MTLYHNARMISSAYVARLAHLNTLRKSKWSAL